MPNSSNRKHSAPLIPEEHLVDFKLFLNTSIKEKIHNFERPFSDETFIIDHFWRSRFPHTTNSSVNLNSRTHSPDVTMMLSRLNGSMPPSPVSNSVGSKVPIDSFNKAFYQFFNRETKLLQIDQIEIILNECFQYLLKKNKKAISKRNFRSVINRHFKFLFPMVIHQYHKMAQNNNEQLNNEHLSQDNLHKQSNDSLNQQISLHKWNNQSQQYPDSLDTRCPSHQAIIGGYSIHENLSQNNQEGIYQTSTFNTNKKLIIHTADLSTQAMDSVFKLFNALFKIQTRISTKTAFLALKKKKKSRRFVDTQDEKENMRPPQQETYGSLTDQMLSTQKSRSANRNPLGVKQQTTFSFNNSSKCNEDYAFLQQSNPQQYYQSHHKLIYDPYQEEPLVKVGRQNQSQIVSNQQSIGSLAFSATSTKDQNQNCFANLSSVRDENFQSQLNFNHQSLQEMPHSTKSSRQLHNNQSSQQYLMRQNLNQDSTHLFKQSDNNTLIVKNDSHIKLNRDQDMGGIISTRRNSQQQYLPPASSQNRQQQKVSKRRKSRKHADVSSPRIVSHQVSDQQLHFQEPTHQNHSFILSNQARPHHDLSSGYHTNQNMTLDYHSTQPQSQSSRRGKAQSLQNPPLVISNQKVKRAKTRSNSRPKEGNQKLQIISADQGYYERKYRRSKLRAKQIVQDSEYTLQMCKSLKEENVLLIGRIEVMKKSKSDSYRAIMKRSLKIFKIIKKQRLLSKTLKGWQQKCFVHSAILQERLRFFYFKKEQKTFFQWLSYAINRKTRKEKRKLFKIKVKTLKKLLIKKLSKSNSFDIWFKEVKMRSHASIQASKVIFTQVQQDMKYANHQMRTMRLILAMTQLAKVIDLKAKLNKQHAFLGMSRFICPEFHTIKRRQQNHSFNTINHHGRNNNDSLRITNRLDYSMKVVGNKWNKFIDGFEKLYQILKRKQGEKRLRYFQRWRYITYDHVMGQLDISNDICFQISQGGHNVILQPNQTAIFSQTLMKDAKQIGGRSSSLKQPSFYKTNEGFFSADQEPRRLQQSTTIIFSPSPHKARRRNLSNNSEDNNSYNNNLSQQLEMPHLIAPIPHPLMKTVSYNVSDRSNTKRQPNKNRAASRSRSEDRSSFNNISAIKDNRNQLKEALAYLKAKIGHK